MSEAITTSNNRFQDRRQNMPFLCAFHLGVRPGRRKSERRASARGKPVYVDSYANHLMFCAVAILLLSTTDAFLTLKILAKGGEELNWFMAVLIEESVEKFIFFKLALTGLALAMLVIHHNVQLIKGLRVWHLKYMILVGYSTLIGYELYLLKLASTVH